MYYSTIKNNNFMKNESTAGRRFLGLLFSFRITIPVIAYQQMFDLQKLQYYDSYVDSM